MTLKPRKSKGFRAKDANESFQIGVICYFPTRRRLGEGPSTGTQLPFRVPTRLMSVLGQRRRFCVVVSVIVPGCEPGGRHGVTATLKPDVNCSTPSEIENLPANP